MRESPEPCQDPVVLSSLIRVLRSEIRVWGPLAVLSFLLASVVMSGFPTGLKPQTQYPYQYRGRDEIFFAWAAQRLVEGSFYESSRNGYPFGSQMNDFPIPEVGNLLALKLLSEGFGSYVAGVNIFFLLGFSLATVTAYGTLRTLGFWQSLAACGAVLFSFLPFHLLRFSHLLVTWYFAIPIFFYLGGILFFGGPNLPRLTSSPARRGLVILAMVMLGCFGVYWSFFGGIVLAVSGLSGSLRSRSGENLILAVQLTASLLVGVVLTVTPSFSYWTEEGRNPEVAHRKPLEVDLYGLKISQLLLPRPEHRVPLLASINQRYKETFPLVTENESAALGVVGSLGLGLLFWVGFTALAGLTLKPRLAYFASVTGAFVTFATIGGLSTPFALLVTPMIRGWNRCSVFIGFACLAAALWTVQLSIKRWVPQEHRLRVAALCSTLLLVLGLLDQTSPADRSTTTEHQAFEIHRDFVQTMELALPPASAVYQLPYQKSLEEVDLHELSVYDVLLGMLHSEKLHWNLGGMKGREGDLYYRALSHQPLPYQLAVAKRLGFRAIYVDRRGYSDRGQQVEAELVKLLGAEPAAVSSDHLLSYFHLPQGGPPMPVSPAEEVYAKSGFRPAETKW